MSTLEENFINDVCKRLHTYIELGHKTFAQLTDEDILFRPNEDSNSIAMIVHHLHGNMLSRFTNFLTEDGEKPWRNRDAEFEEASFTKAQTIALWNEGWQCVMNALQALQPADLAKTVYIRTEPLLAYDAILRQLAHYPYHVGQIVFIGKMIKGNNWQTLSIARGKSHDFNQQLQQQLKDK